MIHQLKTLFKPYVRSEADIDAWIDNGNPYVIGKSLMTDEEFVVNLKQISADVHVVIAVAALWYEKHAGTMSDDKRESGITYDVSIINEDDYELQLVFQMRRKFMIDVDDENGEVNAYECFG